MVQTLKRKKTGEYIIRSASHVQVALNLLRTCERTLEELLANPIITDLENEISLLRLAINQFVLDNDGYEDDSIKITRVQAFRRTWNAEKLENLVPRGIFKNLVTFTVKPEKIDEYVRQGKLNAEKIAAAYEESPNAPFTRWSKKSQANGAAEAQSLAEKLA